MTLRPKPVLALSLAVIGAAVLARNDDDMVKQCRAELENRLFGGATHGESIVTAQETKHEADRILVRLELASGEGRSFSGTCVFRDGQIFDVK
jgi:hypothetical protein